TGAVAVVDRAEAGAVADLQLLTVLDRLVQPAGRPAQRGPGVLAEPHAGGQRRGEAAAGAVGIPRIDAVGRHPIHTPVRVHDGVIRPLPAGCPPLTMTMVSFSRASGCAWATAAS